MDKLLEAIKHRDQAFLEKFCTKGKYMGITGGEEREMYVCKFIDAAEMLDFMHKWDAVLREVINGSTQLEE